MTSTSPAKRTAPSTAKRPTDRQKSADALRAEAKAERPDGADLLRPLDDLRSKEISEAQATIMELFEKMGIDINAARDAGEEVKLEIDMTPDVIRALGDLSEMLEGYALDPEAFARWDRGPGSQNRATELAMWFLAQLGE
jgi:hypothetical protein